jgi:indole-3-glycerol phosphate synthase / phosphoribosylanthranilate isomerase
MNILAQIVESKNREIAVLHQQYDLHALRAELTSSQPIAAAETPLFYQRLAEARAAGQPFFITEFKRKSPSEGWINRHADLPTQIQAYAQAGASAISVLTDEPFFGGNYADLQLARQTLDIGRWTEDVGLGTLDVGLRTEDVGLGTEDVGLRTEDVGLGTLENPQESNIFSPTSNIQRPPSSVQYPTSNVQHPTSNIQRPPSSVQYPTSNVQRPTSSVQRPLLLQKDFILDPLQIYLAKRSGADLILLIAAILEAEHLDFLRRTAESLGMGALVEVHDAEELEKIQHLDFQVLGINNRDLKTFRTSLNRANVLRQRATERFVVAESGVLDHRHFQAVKNADGFLIGTGLMRGGGADLQGGLAAHFQTQGRLLFKACGLRTPETLAAVCMDGPTSSQPINGKPDFIGLNFSPLSKRRADERTIELLRTSPDLQAKAVAVFYQNSEDEIRATLEKWPFKMVQLYAADVSPDFVRGLRQRVILAARVSETFDFQSLEAYAADVDFFILDGASPGSGQRMGAAIPADFAYPFLLAGGLGEENLAAALGHPQCIGVDVASGIETDGAVDVAKIGRIAERLAALR